ncbi:uncharacterized protein LOC135502196 [Lineus longissimus]|uniref:uncharacterized protein LOC135502196 n=1 Tax=Lineus longissimus TaxID=88925 RepID=UPI002B4DB30F
MFRALRPVMFLLGILFVFSAVDCKLNSGDGNYDMVLMVEKTNGVEARKNLAKALITRLNVSPDNDRLALYSYIGQDMKVFYELTGTVAPSKPHALKKVASIKKKTSTKKTNMFFELKTAASDLPTSFMPARFLRAKSKKAVVFVASAGVSPAKMTEAVNALKQLKTRSIKLVVFDYNSGASAPFVKALKANGGTYIPFTDANIGAAVAKFLG